MKTRLVSVAAAALIMAWAPHGSAQQTVALPGVVDAVGEADGVITDNNGALTVGPRNINTNGVFANAIQQNPLSAATVNFGFNSTVTGVVGTAVSPIASINVGANATTVIFNGTVFATTLNVTGTGVVNFNGNTTAATNFAGDGFINLGSGRLLTGAVITATANTGTLTLNGGSSVTGAIGGANGVRQINVVGGNASITGAVQTRGFSLGANTLTLTAGSALTTNAGGTVATSFATNSVFGNVQVLGASLINPGGITVIPTVGGPLTIGTTYTIINGVAGGVIGTPVFIINNDPRFTFIGVPVNIEGDVRITLAAVAFAAPGAPPAAAAVGSALGTVGAPGGALAAVQNIVFLLPAAAVNTALTQLSPGRTNVEAPWVAAQTTRLFEDLWMARVEEIQDLCCDACEPGKSGPVNAHKCTGDERRGNWWGKGFGNWGRQGDTDGLNGYRSKAVGLMLAYDAPLNNRTRAGVGFGVANTTLDENNSTARTKFDSYQLTGYLSYAPRPWFVQGALTVGVDKYDGSRDIVIPGFNRSANSEFNGRHYTAMITAGRHFPFGMATTVTPLASLQATRLQVDGYTESGAGDVGLRVNSQKYDFVQSSLGVKAERVMRSANGTYSPEVHFKWLHDFSSTQMKQDAAFAGGGPTFLTEGIMHDRDLYNVGAGVTFLGCRCGEQTWTVKGLYDYKWNNSNYSSHQLSVLASLKF